MSESNNQKGFLEWLGSNPIVGGVANFLSDPVGNLSKTGQDLQVAFTGYDARQPHLTSVDENGNTYDYSLSQGGYIYKTPEGKYTNHRGYAYLSQGNNGKLTLNVSKSVAESDWFKTQFTDNDTFRKIVQMYNANPGADTTISTTDADGNVKNVTLAEAVQQYNDALGQYASNYEGISSLRDYYNNNTGLNLTDDQIRISENSLDKEDDKNSDSKVIYIPDSWQAIYDFSKLPSWDKTTKTVSAKDFFDVYNLDEKGSINEEQWQALTAASEAELENAFSGVVAKNLNTEDPEAIKYAGDKLAKAIAAAKTLNNSKPDVSGIHAAAIFTSAVGEEFASKLAKTYGNLSEFVLANTEWLANSPVAPISMTGELAQGALFLADTPSNAALTALGAVGEDIASGALSQGNAKDYVAEVKESLENSWAVIHGDKDFSSEYKFPLTGTTLDEFTGAIDTDIDYMEKISSAAAGGKAVGDLLEMAVEVYITEKTGGLVGGAITTTGMNIGRGLGLVFKGSKIKDQANILTKLFLGATKMTAWTGNMMVQGFMDTIESDAGNIASQILRSDEVSEEQKKELYTAMSSNVMYNMGSSIVIDGAVPKFLETKPGQFVQARLQKGAAVASLPWQKGKIALAKLINGVGAGKKVTKEMMESLEKSAVAFGVNDLNSYNVKLAEANYSATKQIATAKAGKTYIDAITGEIVTPETTTKAIQTAVSNKMRFQNMMDRVAKGTKAEMEEILNSPDVAKAKTEADAAATKAIEAEGKAGKASPTLDANGTKAITFAQEDTNYLVNKKNLDYIDRKEAKAIADGKELSKGDKEFQTALRAAVEGFESVNSPRLIKALNDYYEANMAFNKTLTDWEVMHGLMSKETYESLKETGFFGAEDEFYMHSIAIKTKGPNFTEGYAEAMGGYQKGYRDRARESYRINPEYNSDQHISRVFDPETNYLDLQLTNVARVTAMAQAYQAKNWGRALLGTGGQFKEMDTLGKLTEHKQVNAAMAGAKNASVNVVEKLKKDELQPMIEGDIVSLGKAATDEYDLQGRIDSLDTKEAKKLGINDDNAISKNVTNLGDDQVAKDISGIKDSPNYRTVRAYEEVEATIESMPTAEMKAKANKMMETQGREYDKSFGAKTKEFEAKKKERLAQATTLEKEASDIDKEIARIEKANASGKAKYEKAKASAEKKIKAAEEKAKKAAAKRAKYEESLAKDNEFYSGITDKRGKKMYNDLYNDLNDASIDQFQFDMKDAQELDMEDAISAVSEARSEEVSNVFKKGTNKKEFINRRRELANLVDDGKITKAEAQKKLIEEYVDPGYLNNARVKAFGKNDTAAIRTNGETYRVKDTYSLSDGGNVSKEELASHNVPKSTGKAPSYVENAGKPSDYGTPEYMNREKTPSDFAYEAKAEKERLDSALKNRAELEANGWKDASGKDWTNRPGISDENGNTVFYEASDAEKLDQTISIAYERYNELLDRSRDAMMPEPFVPTDTADKVAEAAAKREEATRIREEVDSLKAPRSLSDKQKAVKAWNDAVKKTTMVDDLNRMWLQDAITNKNVQIPEEVMAEIKTQIAYSKLAENTQSDLINERILKSNDPNKTQKAIEKWGKDFDGTQEEALRLKKLLGLQEEGVAPFAEASRGILDSITENTKLVFDENPVTKQVLDMAKEQGVDPELVKDYMSYNALLTTDGNGELVLRNDIKAATKARIQKELLQQIGDNGDVTSGMINKIVKDFQGVIEETAKNRWALAQKKLLDAGGNSFTDVEKSFNFVKKEMEKFVGQFNCDNVIPMLNADGEMKYYEVSPLVADLYLNRPVTHYGKVSEFFNKTSRIARISNTNLNATSVVNQCFRDPLNAYVGAGMYKGFKAYENEMAELFGPELVAHLQETMSKAGWDVFTEGGAIAGKELEKKAARYVVQETGVDTFAKETTQNALFEKQRTAMYGARNGALDNLEAWNNQYKKAKLSINNFIDKGAKIVGAPGYIINESRELFLRRSTYSAAFNSALKQGKTLLEAKNVAEFVSRQATTNFGRTFMWGNSIVNAVPFLGAAINGSASFWRLAAMDPVGVMSRFVIAGVSMMSIVAQSMTTKRDRDAYKTVPEWMKQENLVFVYDGEVFKIPIPQEMAALLAPFRQAVEKSNPGVQSHEWLELLTNDLLEVSPISLDGFETLDEVNIDGDPTFFDRLSREGSALVSQFAPPLLKTAYMATVGVDPYTGNPIDTSYKWVDEDGNLQIIDNTQSSFAKWFSSKLEDAGIEKSTSVCYKLLNSAFGTGLMNVADGITNLFQGKPITEGIVGTQLREGLQAVKVEPYQLQDPYLREFKATIKELEDVKNSMLAADGDLAMLSQQLSMLKETDSNYETKRKNLIQQYNQKTEDYRNKVLEMVTNYNNHYGSQYTAQQFASVVNLLTFQESTLMPTNAYQSEQLSQMFYSAREQAYQTMIDMGFDSTSDNSIFGIAKRNKYTGEVEIKYTSPTVILNMDNVAMGSGRVYAAELEQTLKNAGLTKSKRIELYNEAKAKGNKALKEFKKEWNANVAQAISDTMNRYGSSNIINSNDATQLLNEYFYISNTSYKVKDYLRDVFGEEE